jgi:hypothetical protein
VKIPLLLHLSKYFKRLKLRRNETVWELRKTDGLLTRKETLFFAPARFISAKFLQQRMRACCAVHPKYREGEMGIFIDILIDT